MDPRSTLTPEQSREVTLPSATNLRDKTLRQDVPPRSRSLLALSVGDPFEELFDAAGVGLAMADAEGRLVRVNAAYAFLLAAPPLAVTNGFGSPVNPLALK